MTDRVAIVGGGWAGMAAAVTLACAARPVTVFEAAQVLGVRAPAASRAVLLRPAADGRRPAGRSARSRRQIAVGTAVPGRLEHARRCSLRANLPESAARGLRGACARFRSATAAGRLDRALS